MILRCRARLVNRGLRLLLSLAAVAAVTYLARSVAPVNATTAGFAYLLLVLVIATAWGFIEAAVASISASLAFNFYFLPPIGTFTIADPQNWVALFSFLTTALIGSRLSAQVKREALDGLRRQQDLERLYTYSRALLLIDAGEPFAKQLIQKLADTFELDAAVLYDRRSGEIYRAGPSDFEGLEEQLRDAALHNSTYADPEKKRVITAVRLGSEPIASLALQGAVMPDSVLQGLANLVAIGLERARAQDLAHQVEAARRSEQLRATLIDAMAHEFKTPLTSIKAATTSLLASPGLPPPSRNELLKIADEEADHLRELIDNAEEIARLDSPQIKLRRETADLKELVQGVVKSLEKNMDGRPLEFLADGEPSPVGVDRRLMALAVKQVLDNAIKYSMPQSPIGIRIRRHPQTVDLEITDHGKGIPVQEQALIFERFYRSPAVKRQVVGSGLGLSIAKSIVKAHNGELTVSSHPGETTFQLTLPLAATGEHQ
jgi:two-component system, OmpR family, sensor histidine kinase KdpD